MVVRERHKIRENRECVHFNLGSENVPNQLFWHQEYDNKKNICGLWWVFFSLRSMREGRQIREERKKE